MSVSPRTRLRNLCVAPPGWDSDSESDSETEVPPPDVMEAFLLDVSLEKQAPPQSEKPAPFPFERSLACEEPASLLFKGKEKTALPEHQERPVPLLLEQEEKPALLSLKKPAPPLRFAAPLTDKEVEEARKTAIPKKTQKDTEWCMRIWREWRCQRNSITASNERVPDILTQLPATLQRWMSRFVLEVRKKDGAPYPPNSVYHIVCGIMRFIRLNGKPEVDFFRDQDFAEFRGVLDAEMKRLKASGIGSQKRQAEPLSLEEEELLWEKGVLGDHSPQALLNTVFFFNGIHFALRSGDEHRRLRHGDSQIQVVEKPGERSYLLYVEDVSKNNQGGLKGRKNKAKEVTHYDNKENPSRCPVRIFKVYNSLCPSDRPENALYLQPLKKPRAGCWFSAKPLGHNPLDNMVKQMCKAAGIEGYKTNHSLRATTATRLYQAGVDEQLIMERTGHRSLDGVRSYKRTSQQQKEALSDIMNLSVPEPKQQKLDIGSSSAACSQQQIGMAPAQLSLQNCSNININISYGQM